MQLNIRGTTPAIPREEIKAAVLIMLAHLVPEDIFHEIRIDLQIMTFRGKNQVAQELEADSIYLDDDADHFRHFRLRLSNRLNYKDTLIALAHELAHIKQYALGELGPNFNEWHGELIDTKDKHYYFWPWEIEAHGLEPGLFWAYNQYLESQCST